MDTSEWDPIYQFVVGSTDDCARMQVPTPPQSHSGSPVIEEDQSDIVNVSSTFYPGAQLHSLPPDVILLSSDHVFFYVNSNALLEFSSNGFGGRLPVASHSHHHKHGDTGNRSEEQLRQRDRESDQSQMQPDVLNMDMNSNVLNIILHAIYNISCVHYNHDVDTIIASVDAMPPLGLPLQRLIASNTPLFTLLLSQAPLYHIQIYALASRYDLYDLAVPTSSHLLAYSLHQIDDNLAERIGPVYLKRLFFLHFGRMEALKRILLNPPHPHAPTHDCDFTDQKKLTRAWALASAYLAWDARPDLSISSIEAALNPLSEHLACDLCQRNLKERVKDLVVQWSVVRRTI